MSVTAGLDATEAPIYIDGALYSAPEGTTKPTSESAVIGAGFVGHGLWSSAGLTESSSRSVNKIRAFQLNQIVASVTTEGNAVVKLVLLQSNADNASLYYLNGVDTTDGSVDWNPGAQAPKREFVIDKLNGAEVERIVGTGQVTNMDDRVTTYGEITGYGVEITFVGVPKIYNSEWVVP
jgi:hypothetical protein